MGHNNNKKKIKSDLSDPRAAKKTTITMDSGTSPTVSDADFAFAFNDSNFSDRILRIEIISDLPETKSDGDGCCPTTLADWARNRKRRREDIKKEPGFDF